MELFLSTVGQYKSSLYETARNLLRSRDTQRSCAEKRGVENLNFQLEIKQLRQDLHDTKQQLVQTQQILQHQQQANEELRQRPISLPSDLALPHHTYGQKMISLCLNMCKEIGFRRTETALKIMFKWLDLDVKVPSFDSMRVWLCRAGIAQLNMLVRDGEAWIWLADHSNQIGQEKILQIIGIRVSDLPPLGETLPRDKMVVLATIPGTSWTREDVRREYKKLADRIGAPKYLVTDGASELRDSADVLESEGKKPILLRDLKHYAANVFENLIGKDERFQEYQSKLAGTRNAVQQTKLSHFTPPPQKPKSRFMNLGPILRWGHMVSHHLSDCHSQSRKGIKASKMKEKLGWVRGFRDELAAWNRCEEVMQASLRLINRHGVYRGVATKLKDELDRVRSEHPQRCELSSTMASKLVAFVEASETQLDEGERAWLSTENLESLFGQYKRLEGQHSKGGFTSLVATMPMLLTHCTPDLVRAILSTVSVKEMNKWVTKNLGTTLNSKRNTAYKEFANSYG